MCLFGCLMVEYLLALRSCWLVSWQGDDEKSQTKELTFLSISDFPFFAIVAIFTISAVFVWMAGTRLAIYGDELSERLDLSREFIGLIFLATVTELPEIVTTATAALSGNAPLERILLTLYRFRNRMRESSFEHFVACRYQWPLR